MNKQTTNYQSISCSLYDELEALATKHTNVPIVYKDSTNEMTVKAVIVDLFAKDGAEFLKLNNGTIIRLDHLVTVNGIPMNKVC
ncbi:MAG: hypothetical protein PHP42_06655 [Bacteroidota bacterium]|nr:hypothetical protein [Bacteroidota bacterium]